MYLRKKKKTVDTLITVGLNLQSKMGRIAFSFVVESRASAEALFISLVGGREEERERGEMFGGLGAP